jgi:lipopolysaccharide biosynthesis glycosyltransferase
MKVEGIEVERWNKERFQGRTIEVYATASEKTTINVPDSDILCDYYNSEIKEFPVAVWDCMAYCKECYEKYLKPNIK